MRMLKKREKLRCASFLKMQHQRSRLRFLSFAEDFSPSDSKSEFDQQCRRTTSRYHSRNREGSWSYSC
eukprot:11156725-Karenia_brevis.AAC.1